MTLREKLDRPAVVDDSAVFGTMVRRPPWPDVHIELTGER
jgi:hypothetical protein